MAKYIESVCKLCRREGVKLFLKGERCMTPKCALERRPYPPGMHGQRRQFQRKVSDYGMQLREKQKARRIYGVLERQFRRYYDEAEKRKGLTGLNLLRALESRLDNVVYRLGFASSRAQARQLVRHGHFEVNGRKTDIPSYLVKPGDTIAVREKSKESNYFKELAKELGRGTVPNWMTLDPVNLSGRIIDLPSREDVEISLDESLIVEHYSR
ncbi:MAG: 30S ribosomal protein S4 [Anaerolineae bacterium]